MKIFIRKFYTPGVAFSEGVSDEKNQISIQNALTQLKTIDKKIVTAQSGLDSATLLMPGALINGLYSAETFKERASNKISSVKSLIKHKAKLKAAIYASNSVTNVKIADKTMTVAEAITKKESLPLEKNFYAQIERTIKQQKAALALKEESVKAQADKLVEQTLGKEASKDPENGKAIIEQYKKTNTPSLILTMKEDELETILSEIAAFEDDVDIALSESNALTKISI